MNKDLQTALKSHRRLRRYGGKSLSLSKKTASIKGGHGKNLFSISLRQPQGRLLGDPGRGEDPFLPTWAIQDEAKIHFFQPVGGRN